MIRLIFVLLLFLPLFASAAPIKDYSGFAKLPILHDGRIKPISSFARANLAGDQPVELMAALLFNPDEQLAKPLFKIKSDYLIKALSLPSKSKGEGYSYNEIAPRLDSIRPTLQQIADKDVNQYSSNEKSLWALYESIGVFAKISRSLSLLEPLAGDVSPALRTKFNLPKDGQLNYLQVFSAGDDINESLKKVIARKGDAIASYSISEQDLAKLSFSLAVLQVAGSKNDLLRVLPLTASDDWVAPWQVIEKGLGSPRIGVLMNHWKDLSAAYKAKDIDEWNKNIASISANYYDMSGVYIWKLELETLYNDLSLLPKIAFLYWLIFLLAIACYIIESSLIVRILPHIFSIALLLHCLVIISRVFVLGRPPVGTLYESVLFVSLISAAYGYMLSKYKTSVIGFLIGSFIGGLLLAVSDVYAGDGDTMGVLVAVLNTNIWLATHVICVTIGYGCALVAGTLAHLGLLSDNKFSNIYRILPFVTVVALLFTAVGTILGGVWADQSWGRFWGWDPKENGALWIVLWLIWLMHGRMMPVMGERGFMALLAFTNVIVALSWFGVNLLGAGLHSYGFTDSAAIGLFVFCVSEIVIIASLYAYPKIMRSKPQ